MNRYSSVKTDDRKVLILDTIIRFPNDLTPLMTREALAIRESIPNLARGLLRSKNRAGLICVVIGSGWTPLPDNIFFDRSESGRVYKEAIKRLAEYLEGTGELYDGLIVA